MARRKKPENETTQQTKSRQILEQVADHATRSEKTSWHRMMDNMVTALSKLRPIEDKILKLENEKVPILDEINALRSKMVRECVHPYDHLILSENSDTVTCKFCNHSFTVNEQRRSLLQ